MKQLLALRFSFLALPLTRINIKVILCSEFVAVCYFVDSGTGNVYMIYYLLALLIALKERFS